MNRKREQAEVFFQFGQLIGPLLKVAENPETDSEHRKVMARFFADVDAFKKSFLTFAAGESGHDYRVQVYQAFGALAKFETGHRRGELKGEELHSAVKDLRQQVFEALHEIPVPVESAVYDARTPFSTYRLVRDLCSTAQSLVLWMDRYFDQTLFHRYLADVPESAVVTLVTLPDTKLRSPKDLQRHSEFMNVSKLFAQERGPDRYRLVFNDAFHDRWLRCDDKLFHFGGSIKDLGADATFTISKLDFTPENVRAFEEPLSSGREVFGPTQRVHP